MRSLLLLLFLPLMVRGWFPSHPPRGIELQTFDRAVIRGVNIGSLFVYEPWMAQQTWHDMGCKGANSEFACVRDNFGGDIGKASIAFQNHWASWYTQADIFSMTSLGLNTIRIPVGWWMKEDLVQTGEYFARGGLAYLSTLCGWAADAGMFIIIDMHAAPGTQKANEPNNGNVSDKAYFYQSGYQAGRAIDFLSWMVGNIHSDWNMRNVGAIELINEPKQAVVDADTLWLLQEWYPSAIDAIRQKEADLSIAADKALHTLVMDDYWSTGGDDPAKFLSDTQKNKLYYDDHNYQAQNVSGLDQNGILDYTCKNDRTTPLEPGTVKVVGEWSMNLDEATGLMPPENYKDFYNKYFAAQQEQYEKTNGWFWWSWKTESAYLPNYQQWSYSAAVSSGLIGTDLDAQLGLSPCRCKSYALSQDEGRRQ